MYSCIFRLILACLLFGISQPSFSQVGIGTTTPDNSSILDIESTTGGILIPRMSQVQRLAIATPATGLMVFQNDNTIGFWYFDGTTWINLPTTAGAGEFQSASGVVSNTSDLANDDFVFGSATLNGTDSRFFFDKSLGAFRAGNTTGNAWDTANLGVNSTAFGNNSIADGNRSFATNGGQANGDDSIALSGVASGDQSVSMLLGDANGDQSLAIQGGITTTNGNSSVAIMPDATADAELSMALGPTAIASGNTSVAIGINSDASGEESIAIGPGVTTNTQSYGFAGSATATFSMGLLGGLGDNVGALAGMSGAVASGPNSLALGLNALAQGDNSVAFTNAIARDFNTFSTSSGDASGVNSVAMAAGRAEANNTIAIGQSSFASSENSIAIGENSLAQGAFSLALARGTATFNATGGIAIGNQAFTDASNAIAVGNFSSASGDDSIAIGNGALADGFMSVALSNGFADGQDAFSIGGTSFGDGTMSFLGEANADNAIALGQFSIASENAFASNGGLAQAINAIAISSNALASDTNAIAIGSNTLASNVRAVAIGVNSSATGLESMALSGGIASADNTLALGRSSNASGLDAVSFTNGFAGGERSLAANGGIASGLNSVAMVNGSASGDYSFALGNSTFASGNESTAIGSNVEAHSFGETVFGYNSLTYTPNSSTAIDSNDRLFVVGNGTFGSPGNALTILKNGSTGIARIPTTNTLEVNGNASKAIAGDWLANSDARLKKNIETIPQDYALTQLLKLRGVTYEWNDYKTENIRPSGLHIGFVAQEIQEVFPQFVQKDNEGFLQTSYGTYDALYIQAIKELTSRLNDLEAEYENLLERFDKVETILKSQIIDN